MTVRHKQPLGKKFIPQKPNTSWEKSSKWYGKIVKDEGHYYHEHVILPRLKELLPVNAMSRVLDIGCGEGVFARTLPPNVSYTGIDLSATLIKLARERSGNKTKEFIVSDATQPMSTTNQKYTHAVAILSLQNMENARAAIQNVGKLLAPGGVFAIVLNHPAFRIPRQSGWELDQGSSEQKRWVKRYMSEIKIPIEMRPGSHSKSLTWSFHRPLQAWFKDLRAAGLAVTDLEEWTSDKESTSKFKKREDRARNEIPLFMCIVAKK